MSDSYDDYLYHESVYDPAARRARYLRDRQLKGRFRAGVKEIKEKPKAKSKSKDKVKRITDRLEAWSKAQAKKTKRKMEAIDRETKRKIEALPKIQEWMTEETKSRLRAAHAVQVSKIRGEGQKAKTNVRNSALAERNRKVKQVRALIKKTAEDSQKSKTKTA